jgi:alkanesulfonate monooxygenase SsuD/methylene tetrahydromethanopterin reductase-like flavin-dependent oxidoreductase (luciferase family)
MAKMDFAFWDSMGYTGDNGGVADIYDEHIRLAQRVEELGWSSYFVIEHQNAGRISSPSVYLTAVARATSQLRVGAMIWQLPFYHPLRLAEEVAMLDQLSRGRVDFGAGFGVHEHEFMRWGLDFYQRHAMSAEILEIVKMAWTKNEVTYDGEYFHLDEALPQPKPYQQPHPPIWAAVHAPESIEQAARSNYNLAKNIDPDDIVEEKFNLYRKVWKESNHPGPMPHIFLMRSVHVAETDEKAHEEARQFIATGEGRAARGNITNTRIGWGSHARGMGRDSEAPDAKRRGELMEQAAKSYEFNIDNGLAIVGSPETVVRKLEEGQARLGYDVFCTNQQIGRMPPDMVANSTALFGKEVIPAFK